jgi:SAM-dependent methyltransferase
VISNCVINLSGDKPTVLAEAARVLRPGGRFAVSDVIADDDMDDATKADMQAYTGCIAGALTRSQFEQYLSDAGFHNIEIQETHRVHASASAAIVRATKPSLLPLLSRWLEIAPGGCCGTCPTCVGTAVTGLMLPMPTKPLRKDTTDA